MKRANELSRLTNPFLNYSIPGLMARTLPVLLPVLSPHFSLPTTKRILEFSSGEGAHLVEFAKLNPTKSFKATEADAFAVGAINDHVRRSNVTNVEEASVLDLLEESDWKALEAGEGKYQVVFGINFLHMVPWYVHSQHFPMVV